MPRRLPSEKGKSSNSAVFEFGRLWPRDPSPAPPHVSTNRADFGVTERTLGESMKTSKGPPISSLTRKARASRIIESSADWLQLPAPPPSTRAALTRGSLYGRPRLPRRGPNGVLKRGPRGRVEGNPCLSLFTFSSAPTTASYVGSTRDLEMRLVEHNDGPGGQYTACRRPVQTYLFRENARRSLPPSRAERQIKRWSAA